MSAPVAEVVLSAISGRLDGSPLVPDNGAPRKPSHRGAVLRRIGIRALVPSLIIGAWCAVSYGGAVRAIYLPTPSAMWSSLDHMRKALPGALATSVTMTLTGFAIGTALGVGMGLAFAYSKLVRDLFGDVLTTFFIPIDDGNVCTFASEQQSDFSPNPLHRPGHPEPGQVDRIES